MKRNISQAPLVYQKKDNTCIYCSIIWIQQWIEFNKKLSCDELIEACNNSQKPIEILNKAKELNFIKDFEILNPKNKQKIIEKLIINPIMVGVDDYLGSGAHMMAGFEVSDDGNSVKCVNWFNKKVQETTFVPFDEITFACSILKNKKNMSLITMLKDKFKGLSKRAKIGGGIGVMILALLGGYTALPNQEYGSAGVVANYSSTISGSGISSTDTSIPVSSVTLYTGETFTSSDLIFPVYLMINPKGSTRELVECWGLTSLTFTSCGRGLSAKGGNTTSTVSGANFAHASGEVVIMTDAPYFFNRFVDTSTDQSIAGEKTVTDSLFSFGDGTGQIVWNGSNMGWSDDDGSNTYTFVAGGSGLSASSTKGIGITDSKIWLNASSTYGLAFDAGGKLYINASSTASNNGGFMKFTGNKLYWDYPSLLSKANTWTGIQTIASGAFSGVVTTTANYLQITTDADSANDAVRKSYLDSYFIKSLVVFGSGADGDVTISGNTSLTKDMFYNNLTVNNAITLNASGYRIYVKGTLTNNGTISNAGGNGGNSSAGAGGTAGAAGATGSLGGGAAGAAGVFSSGNGACENGVNGAAISSSVGSAGGNGGGAQSANPATGGTAGAVTASKVFPRVITLADQMIETGSTIAIMKGGSGGASGGSSCRSINNPVVQTGGGGGGGGIVFISALTIINAGSINANGGNAGTGSVTTDTGAAGGSGGGGGGFVYLRYSSKSGAGSVTATGGTKSVKVQTSGTAVDGSNGSDGNVIEEIII